MLLKRVPSPRTGATAIEFAFVVPLVLAIFFAFVEHGRYLMVKELAQNAAREGARYAAVCTSGTAVDDLGTSISDTHILSWIERFMIGQDLQLSDYKITLGKTDSSGVIDDSAGSWMNLQYGELIAVRIEGKHKVWLPLLTLLPSEMQIDVRAVAVAEAN